MWRPEPEGIKLVSCSTQLSTKFQLLIETKIPTNEEVSCFKSHFNINEQDNFELSRVEHVKSCITSGTDFNFVNC